MKYLFLPLFLIPALVYSDSFSTSYISFDIPNKWSCTPEGPNWICAITDKKKKKEAVIIMTAKETGQSDNLQFYMNYLKSVKKYTFRNKPVSSKVLYAKRKLINNYQWIDGLHLESELPKYYTRYIVTTKSNLAVLVTYTAHQSVWTKYSPDFEKSINSIRLLNVSEALRKIRIAKSKNRKIPATSARSYLGNLLTDEESLLGEDTSNGSYTATSIKVVSGLAFISALIFFNWKFFKRRRKKKSEDPSQQRRRRV